jgi:hypothetical protein
MGLWERVLHYDTVPPRPSLSGHWLLAFLTELNRGQVTRAQVDAGLGLDAAEAAELTTLIQTVTALPAGLQRLARAKEIEEVILLGEARLPPYDSVQAVKTRLGV